LEELDLKELYQTYSRIKENCATPRQMLKIMLYAYMNHNYSSRCIESACKRDVNFMYLLEGAPAPDHATIARFRSLHFAPVAKTIMARMTVFLKDCGEISFENLFIDGTKIESTANRYTFVWKKAVDKNLKKMIERIPAFVKRVEEFFEIHLIYDNKIQLRHLKRLKKMLQKIKEEEGTTFVHGIGRRKPPLQKAMEELQDYLDRFKKYIKQTYLCGDRNSFSKTDTDATFMRMKEDHMGNGQLKPAYNLQLGVDSEYVVWAMVGPQPTDTTTLKPFLDEVRQNLGHTYRKVITDSGYESEENYVYLEENDQLAFIKPSNYEISKTKKYRTDISRRENMKYDSKDDCYICCNGKRLMAVGEKVTKNKTGYRVTKTVYSCESCENCPHKTQCIKGNNSKTPLEDRTKKLEVSKVFQEKRTECLDRILSDEGIELRMNRSIQSEGAFADIKGDMEFRRFLTRGYQNVLAESIFLAMGHNINKLHSKIQNGCCASYLYKVKTA
jgi:transposase